jgi:diadenosine tetraphosphatase ApaH/serine/threonine PP2A family protein phosphatase
VDSPGGPRYIGCVRTFIFSDLHANLQAAEAVFADARGRGFDRSVCLGDLVGYGANPNEVIDLVRRLKPDALVRGNHDKAACGITEGTAFNDAARAALAWTRDALTPESAAWLRALPAGPIPMEGMLLSHGSPLDEEAYILGLADAGAAMEEQALPLALFGHTHYAGAFVAMPGDAPRVVLFPHGGSLSLPAGSRCLLNPGSMGQPRDSDPRAAYALHDDATGVVEVVRVAYDVDGARSAIVGAGLPSLLERRLSLGI